MSGDDESRLLNWFAFLLLNKLIYITIYQRNVQLLKHIVQPLMLCYEKGIIDSIIVCFCLLRLTNI